MPTQPSNPIDSSGGDGDGHEYENQSPIQSSSGDQREAFQIAAQAAFGSGDPHPSEATPGGIEARNLESWARSQRQIVEAARFESLLLISNRTSEHKVFHCKDTDRAIKHTWPGVYGQVPSPSNKHLDRRNASPSEYLKRMALQLQVFGGDIQFEGVFISDEPSLIIGQPAGEPSLVISQQWYEKSGIATNELIHDFLVQEGFRPVPASYFGWYRPEDRVIIVDAKPDNFVLTDSGLVPIDLQMIQFTEDQLIEADLSGDPTAPVIFIPRP